MWRLFCDPCLTCPVPALSVQTPLHLAALTGQPALCRHLLVAGADASLRDRHGNTALHVACARGDLAAAQALTVAVSAAETREAALRYSVPPYTALPQLDEWNYQGECTTPRPTQNQTADATHGHTAG